MATKATTLASGLTPNSTNSTMTTTTTTVTSTISHGEYTMPFDNSHIIFVVLAILIIILNSCVLFAMWHKKVLQKAENALLGSLAVSDLTVGLFGIPLLFVCSFTTSRYCLFCFASFVFIKFISISTVLHILGIIAERYLQVKFPFVHRRLVAENRRVTGFIVALWFVGLAVANAPWTWGNLDCKADETAVAHHFIRYELICLIAFFVLPLVLITFFLTKICLAARRYFRESSKRCEYGAHTTSPYAEVRITIVLVGMFLLFLICWFPYFYTNVTEGLTNFEAPPWFYEVTTILRCLTSVLNPMVYTLYKEDFYQAFKFEAQKMLCCRRTKSRKSRGQAGEMNGGENANEMPLMAPDGTTHEDMLSVTKSIEQAQSVL